MNTRTEDVLARLTSDFRLSTIGDRLRSNVPLGAYTTYRVGGPAAVLIEPHNENELVAVADAVATTGVSTLIVGRGSNLLIADSGFDGVVVHLAGDFEEFTVFDAASAPADGPSVRSGGAVLLPVLARATVRAGWAGFEWAVGIPGSVGGGVMMNAGGHGSEISSCLRSARVLDLAVAGGNPRTLAVDDLDLRYRHSALSASDVVVAVELGLTPGAPEVGEATISDIVRWRREHQPGGANAGSVFANPIGHSAGRLIDEAGLKGLRVGTAAVSDKHANFIQSDPDGSADDVAALMAEVQQRIAEATGIWLRPENRLVGFPADVGPRSEPAGEMP